ncbi:MAG: UDP-N-acetylmuramoyl-tripeptide--D-alanyl-D-alanine ligase [bacterium]|nr:UDP-N-acetylmuramoyl-tripeptide--D-alanyl-D-alanine ligase [bacterium]
MGSWTLDELKAALHCCIAENVVYPENYAGIFTDTRAVVAGGVFVPLVGERFDGRNFVAQALQAGAGAALWARSDVPSELAAAPLLKVEDTLAAYQALGAFNLRRLHIPVVAVTGSVGKTTTKDLIRELLSQRYNVHATPVNHNNDVGAAKTLLELGPQHEIAVIEMGMRGRGQIRRLARLVNARVGVITAIGESHLEILGSRQAIAEAKAELFEEMDSASLAVYPEDTQFTSVFQERISGRSCSFSVHPDSPAVWRLLEYQPRVTEHGLGSSLRLAYPGGEIEVSFSRLGLHNASNLLAALAVCAEFGLAPDELRPAMENFQPTGMRTEIVQLQRGMTLINDAYNAAPSSVRGALEVQGQLASYRGTHLLADKRRCVAVLGDMLELGEGTAEFHRQIGAMCAKSGIEVLIGVGELSGKYMVPAAQESGVLLAYSVKDRREAWEKLQEVLEPGDVVLIKASHSLGLEYLSEKLLAEQA